MFISFIPFVSLSLHYLILFFLSLSLFSIFLLCISNSFHYTYFPRCLSSLLPYMCYFSLLSFISLFTYFLFDLTYPHSPTRGNRTHTDSATRPALKHSQFARAIGIQDPACLVERQMGDVGMKLYQLLPM
jgi:hypothetical protein